MKKKYSRLITILGDRTVTKQSYPEFWNHLQYCFLLALKEQEIISMEQFLYAEGKLKRGKL